MNDLIGIAAVILTNGVGMLGLIALFTNKKRTK
jgi:hypothetical protein